MVKVLRIALIALLTVPLGCAPDATKREGSSADTPIGDALIGEYRYSSGKDRDDVSLLVTFAPEENGLNLNFHGAHPDAHGAAPDGEGSGRVGKDGVFRFTYEDSFRNRGAGTFYRSKSGYVLSIKISEVADSRCLPFYGEFLLQRGHVKK